MKFKVKGQCFYYNRTVYRPGAIVDVDESYADHPALVALEQGVEPDAPLMASAETADAVNAIAEPVDEQPLGEAEPDSVPVDTIEATVAEPENDGFDDVPNIPKSKNKKG